MNKTLANLLEKAPAGAPALLAPGAAPLTYGRLRDLVRRAVDDLNAVGIGRNDRVAIVLPNGPEMASAFCAVAAGATSAPLNPAYRADEFEFYLGDLGTKAIVVEEGSKSPAISVARKLGIMVLTLIPTAENGAGDFSLSGGLAGAAAAPGLAEEDDIALILHTSGTTSRPKIVPLTHKNLVVSTSNIAKTLAFSHEDRGLNIMPLFHIHGLLAGILAPLSCGGSVFCTPGFNALRFFTWMEEANPNWYTAVPTMHQAILARASYNKDVIERHPLRFIRSSSASLPPQVISQLEITFKTPVVEAYGMTEAAHQMASNPLRGERKPGTVGLPAGPEVEIMDDAGNLLGAGEVGEIVIRGENVTSGYENNPKANAEAFVNGWFRTGDQGVKDGDGYVSLTGRLKEIINRGGEKVSPREVDEAMMDHPGVLQVVTFAIPHEKLGEDIAAAVVLREGASVTERELKEFLTGRLAAYKIPRKIVFLEEIPKGPTGKLQRIGLAKIIGIC
jgi:acyl-CoA synthetase (AMP-forming)/AMP-acid ligase II